MYRNRLFILQSALEAQVKCKLGTPQDINVSCQLGNIAKGEKAKDNILRFEIRN